MSEELNEDKVPLPWNPNEQCKLDKKRVATRLSKYPEEEIVGNLFDRECDDLDNTIVKRKDHFIDCVDIPDVPKAKLLKEDWPIVPFPGVPEVEIPKRLMAHLLSCCLKDRTAGFNFEVVQELDENDNKKTLEEDEDIYGYTTNLTIQLGDDGKATTSYLVLGLSIIPQLCFCDEDCGDEDYINIKVNLAAKYFEHEIPDEGTIVDIVITDEQLETFISDHGGGGGGGDPLCSRKIFAQYDDGWFSPMTALFVALGPQFSEDPSTYLRFGEDYDVLISPYLHNLVLTNGGIYKLEYFCEYNKWFVTDGECPEQVSSYTPKHHEYISTEGVYSGEFNLEAYLAANDTFTIRSSVGSGSTITEEDAFSVAPTFLVDEWGWLVCTAEVNSDVSGVIVYNLIITSVSSNKVYACKIVFHIDTTEAEEEGA